MVIKDPNEIKNQCTIKFLFIKIRVNKLRIKESFPNRKFLIWGTLFLRPALVIINLTGFVS